MARKRKYTRKTTKRATSRRRKTYRGACPVNYSVGAYNPRTGKKYKRPMCIANSPRARRKAVPARTVKGSPFPLALDGLRKRRRK